MRRGIPLLLALIWAGFAQGQIIQSEDFDGCALPAGWTESILSGVDGWLFVANSPDPGNAGNFDGTCMVMFDDDWLTATAAPSTVELVSPQVDITGFPLVMLEFDYNVQEYGPATGDGLTVDVWDGTAWVNVLSVLDVNDCGFWGSCTPPRAEIDVTAFANPGFQVRFTYDDGDDWSWYAAFDNFVVMSPPSDDVGVTAVLQPIGGGCSIGPAETVEVEIENFGSAPATAFDVCFEIDGPTGLSSVCENVGALSIAPGATATYTFTATADLSLPGTYDIAANTNLVGDGIPENDTAFLSLGSAVIVPTIAEDFNAYPDGEVIFPDWTNNTDDDQLQWEVNFGGTTSTATGPVDDATGGGGYIYTETSGSAAGDSAILVSECIDLGGLTAPILEFAYHLFGASIDYVRVEAVVGSGLATELLLLGESQFASADPWLSTTVDLSAFAGQVIQIRFTGKNKLDPSGFTFNGDMSLDDIVIREVTGDDLGVTAVLAPELVGCGLSAAENVEVEITNVGSADQTGFDVCYDLSGPTGSFSGCENVGALLVPAVGGIGTYTFATALDFSLPGVYTLTTYTNLVGDGDNSNDTSVLVLDIPAPEALPVEDNFDGYAAGTTVFSTPLANSALDDLDWQVNFGGTSSTATGPDDDVSGGGGYVYTETSGSAIGDFAILESACIDLAGASNPTAGFSYHMFGGSIDSVVFEIIDGSSTVTPLVILDKGQQFASSDPWLDTVVDLSAYIGQVVRLRWKGFVRADPIDGVTTFNGDMSLDEIVIEDPLPDDAGVVAIDAPNSACDLSSSEAISVTIENFGTTDLTAFDVSYQINGGLVVTENVGALLIPVGTTGSYTFATTADFSADGVYDVLAWTTVLGDANNANDSTLRAIENIAATAVFPYTENFDGFSNCGDASFACITDGSCAASVAGGWIQDSGDDIDWSITNGLTTPSGPGTGPSAGDHTSGSGSFLFTESSGCSDQVAILLSPCFDLAATTCPQVNFWYHLFGGDQGTLTLEINAGAGWDTLFSVSGDQGDAWMEANVSLAAYAGLAAQFRLTGRTGTGFLSDMAIDDFSITDNGTDVAVASIDSPTSGCEVGLSDVIVTLENVACLAAPSFDVVLEVDGAVIATDTYPAGLAGLGTASHTFSVPFDFAAVAAYNIKAYTALPGDGNTDNDTATALVTSVNPPVVNTGFDPNYCIGTATYFPTPIIPGGTWSGTGIIDPATGEFDPALVGGGSTTDITYTFTPTGTYSVSEIPFAPETLTAPVATALGDDDDVTVPIGFAFEYFGNAYSDINIHSNGYLTFGSDLNFTVGTPLPTPAEPNDLIALVWDDLNPVDGGSISYETSGVAPNRKFIVDFTNVPHFGSAGGVLVSVQAILYEGSNIIDMQITDIQSDGGSRTQGIENIDGTEGYTSTAATNFTDFTQSAIAYRYSPTPCGNSITETITVDPEPALGIASDTTLCFGDTGVLDAGFGFDSYLWSTGDTTQTITVGTTGTYNVSVVDPIGCSASGSIEVTVSDDINIGGDKVNVDCIGEATGSFNLVITGGTAPYTIIWSTGATGPVLTGLTAGDYGVAIVDANGCTASSTENIREPFDYRVDLTAEDASFGGADGVITANVVGGNDPYTFLWSDGQTTNPATGLAPGTYSVTVTDSAGCTTFAEITVGEASGLDGIQALDAFEVFPNPSEGAFNVQLSLNTAEEVFIEVLNAVGQQVTAVQNAQTLGQTWSFNLDGIAAGAYRVRVRINGQTATRPLMIQR